MKKINGICLLFFIFSFFFSCTKKADNEINKCPKPVTEYYIYGEIDSQCTLFQETLDGYETKFWDAIWGDSGACVGTELTSNQNQPDIHIGISLPLVQGALENIRPDAIKPGNYKLVNSYFNGPDEAIIFIQENGDSYYSEQNGVQDQSAYFKITKVEEVPTNIDEYNYEYKYKVTGEFSCKLFGTGDTTNINDAKFVLKMEYH